MEYTVGIYSSTGAGITGSTGLTIKLRRVSDGYFYCFTHSAFEASPHDSDAVMTEIDATVLPGEYKYTFTVTSWADGFYTAYMNYNDPLGHDWTAEQTKEVQQGVEGGSTSIWEHHIDSTLSASDVLKYLLAMMSGKLCTETGAAGNKTYSYQDQSGAVIVVKVITPTTVTTTLS